MLEQHGIFDRVVSKMQEKETALAEAEALHSINVVKAEKQAALIAQGQVDQSLIKAPPTVDDEIQQNLAAIDQAPLGKLAGMKEKHKQETKELAKSITTASKVSLVQKAEKKAPVVEEEEPRDDFEGFGSITELVKNQDKLVEKTLDDPEFKAEMAAKEAAKNAEKEKEKKKALAEKLKENFHKK